MNLNYHINESQIKCPYCDAEYYLDGEINDFETKEELYCGSCERKFWAEANINYSTYSDCSLNGKDHEFENNVAAFPTVFNCKNCYQHEVRNGESDV